MHYQRIANERELLDSLSIPGAAILCGGTDLIVKMRAGIVSPERLLDITHLEALRGIRVEASHLWIGAATAESDILKSAVVHQHAPLLADAMAQLGSIQIRNRGTLGGNIVNASPAADSAVPLLLYDAEVSIVGPQAERSVPLETFFTGPGRTSLHAGEFVRALRLPLPEQSWRTFYHKVGKRNALTISIASLGVLLRLEGHTVREARVAAGSVAPTPLRIRSLEAYLEGRTLDATTIDTAAKLATDAISPIADVRASADYRRRVIGDLVARALRTQAQDA